MDKNKTTVTLSINELELIAYHASIISREKAPYKGALHPLAHNNAEFRVEYQITPATQLGKQEIDMFGPAGNNMWDSVKINGKSCGNRHGGQVEFLRLVTEALLKREVG